MFEFRIYSRNLQYPSSLNLICRLTVESNFDFQNKRKSKEIFKVADPIYAGTLTPRNDFRHVTR